MLIVFEGIAVVAGISLNSPRVSVKQVRRVWPLALVVSACSAQTPSVAENGVLNSASFVTVGQPGHPVAPGSLVSIFGSELAAGLSTAGSVPLSTSLAGVSVRFNNVAAPMYFVSPGQINAQIPWNTLQGAESGMATVVVTRDGNSSQPRNVQLARFSPAVYTLQAGSGPAVAVNSDDGSLAQPQGSVPGINARPARIGGVIIVYASGLGPVTPPVQDGAASLDALRPTNTTPVVLIGGLEAQVPFSGLAPQFPGVNQLNIVIPQGVTPGGAVAIQIRVAGITTSNQVTIAVQN